VTEISAFNAQNKYSNESVRNGIRERRIADQEGSSKMSDWIVYGKFVIAEAVVFAFAVADWGMTVPTSGVTRHNASPCARMPSICAMECASSRRQFAVAEISALQRPE
jgi:hypothetical protein